MSNTNDDNNIKVIPVSGTLVKTCPKSFFVRCTIDSHTFNELMGSNARYYGKSAVVLQTMLCGGKNETLSEVIYAEDYY